MHIEPVENRFVGGTIATYVHNTKFIVLPRLLEKTCYFYIFHECMHPFKRNALSNFNTSLKSTSGSPWLSLVLLFTPPVLPIRSKMMHNAQNYTPLFWGKLYFLEINCCELTAACVCSVWETYQICVHIGAQRERVRADHQ